MLSSIIIGGDEDLIRYLRQVSADFADVWIYKVLGETARRYEVVAALNSYSPDVVFLDVSNVGAPDSISLFCVEEILPQGCATAIVPYCRKDATLSAHLDDRKKIGVPLRPPFNADDLDVAIREAMRRARPTTHESHVIAVLPAKPGSGASTVAVHMAAAAAGFNRKTLLLEADVYSGALRYMLDLHPAHFVSDALQTRLDTEVQWNGVVTACHGFHLLPASGDPGSVRGSRWDITRLINLAREHYDTVIVDLPSHIDDVTDVVLAEADHSILVATPELPSLNLARRRLFELERRGVNHQHLQLLVNRFRPGRRSAAAMAEIARYPISTTLPEDTASLETACQRMTLASSRSEFARRIATITGSLLALPAEPPFVSLQSLRNLCGSALAMLTVRNKSRIRSRISGG